MTYCYEKKRQRGRKNVRQNQCFLIWKHPNVAPLLKPNTVFEKFAEIENFKRVYLDETSNISWDIDPNIDSNVVWSNKVDICSDECYINSKPI